MGHAVELGTTFVVRSETVVVLGGTGCSVVILNLNVVRLVELVDEIRKAGRF